VGFKEIFDLKIAPGKIALVWFNSYSGVIIKTPITTLIFDPVRIKLGEYIQADAIVVTHEHFDHFAPELVRELQKKTNATVLTTPFVAQRLGGEKTKALKVSDSFAFKDVEFHAERCDHPANQPLSFIISTKSGITIYHPSDSDPFPEMAELEEKHKPNILVYLGTSFRNAAQIAKLVKPKVVLSFYTDKESQRKFIETMKEEVPKTQAKVIKRFEIYQYPN
jgi:L-ascorbate metabolism protein UlaG (beta-lactamase superfamily)